MKSALFTLTFVVLALSAQSSFAGLMDGLSQEEQTAVMNGEQVMLTEDVAGSVWPRVSLYQKTEATAEEIASVFNDIPLHKEMFPGVAKAEIARWIDARTFDADYTMTFPTVLGVQMKDENYTSRNVVGVYENGGFISTWQKIRADSIKDVNGRFRSEPLGSGAVMEYSALISPPRPNLAKMVVDMYTSRMQDTANAIVAQVEKERKEDPSRLQKQVETLRAILNR